MLLALASGNTYLDGEFSSNGPVIHASSEIAAVAKQAFYDFGERPIWTERVTYGTAGECLKNVLLNRRDLSFFSFSRFSRFCYLQRTPRGLRTLSCPLSAAHLESQVDGLRVKNSFDNVSVLYF
jgi:hypothetical protein